MARSLVLGLGNNRRIPYRNRCRDRRSGMCEIEAMDILERARRITESTETMIRGSLHLLRDEIVTAGS